MVMDELANLCRALAGAGGATAEVARCRPDWLERLAYKYEANPETTLQDLFWDLRESLLADGIDDLDAYDMALRMTRYAMLRLLARLLQREAAAVLGVSRRTLCSDTERLARVVVDGSVSERAGSTRPIPVPAGRRIAVALPSRRRGAHG